ncbi:NUDIX domain-containing protein [Streptomyces sp. NPDC093707]|uniref:NUDIX domain-containing protein n=1 Tax=Streptomyces sp. NPDC093707 TaxID=3154984 RepID=UPI00344B9EFE
MSHHQGVHGAMAADSLDAQVRAARTALAARLRYVRHHHPEGPFTLAKLAERAGVSKRTLASAESADGTNLTMGTLVKVAHSLGIQRCAYFLDEEVFAQVNAEWETLEELRRRQVRGPALRTAEGLRSRATPSPDFLAGLVGEAQRDGVTGLVAAAVVISAGRVLLLRRRPGDFMGGLWELPSGKVEDSETLLAALRRETAEETGLTIGAVNRYLGHFDYAGSRGGTTRQFTFAVTVEKSEPVVLTEHDAWQWARPADLPPVSEAVRGLLTR